MIDRILILVNLSTTFLIFHKLTKNKCPLSYLRNWKSYDLLKKDGISLFGKSYPIKIFIPKKSFNENYLDGKNIKIKKLTFKSFSDGLFEYEEKLKNCFGNIIGLEKIEINYDKTIDLYLNLYRIKDVYLYNFILSNKRQFSQRRILKFINYPKPVILNLIIKTNDNKILINKNNSIFYNNSYSISLIKELNLDSFDYEIKNIIENIIYRNIEKLKINEFYFLGYSRDYYYNSIVLNFLVNVDENIDNIKNKYYLKKKLYFDLNNKDEKEIINDFKIFLKNYRENPISISSIYLLMINILSQNLDVETF